LSAKLVSTFVDIGCYVVSVTERRQTSDIKIMVMRLRTKGRCVGEKEHEFRSQPVVLKTTEQKRRAHKERPTPPSTKMRPQV
jgi:hypothetical protein